MAITPQDMRDAFPEFANVGDVALQAAIDAADLFIGDAWGDKADTGMLYLAAHLRTVNARGGAGASGAVQSKRVGDVSVTYATGSSSMDAGSFGSSGYGITYYQMLLTIPGARVSLPDDDYYDAVPDPFTGAGDDGGE